jgi:hypothetical protein
VRQWPTILTLVGLLSASQAYAEKNEEEVDDTSSEDTPSPDDDGNNDDQDDEDTKGGEDTKGDEDTKDDEDESDPAEGYTEDIDPSENEGDGYVFLGLRYRNMILPGAFIRLFADGGPKAVNIFSLGPELVHRQGGLNLHLAASYADFSMDEAIFKGNSEEEDEYERVASDLKVIFLTLDIVADVYEEEKGRFAVSLGGGIGFGFVFDRLHQNQVYPNDPARYNVRDPGTFTNCRAVGDPSVEVDGTPWCNDDNDHYGDFDESSWANGGSLPIIVPWAALPQISLRYKPIKQLQVRTDLGLSLFGPFFGTSTSYGF